MIGDGKSFVRTMESLAARGVSPRVVNDQFGRFTFAADLAAGIAHLLAVRPAVGTYNLTNDGPVKSWFEVARDVFALSGRDRVDVAPQSTAEFGVGTVVAPRPVHSGLGLGKIKSVGLCRGMRVGRSESIWAADDVGAIRPCWRGHAVVAGKSDSVQRMGLLRFLV